MSRTRASAKAAGTRHESAVVAYLREHLDDDRIERRAKSGAKDRGDVSGVRTPHGGRVVIEAKNVTRQALAQWIGEAEVERGNDDALVGLVVAKRHGVGDPGSQYVHMTLRDLVALLTGTRPEEDQ